MGVESGEETEQLNGNKDDQLAHNTVSRGETVSYTHLDVYKRQALFTLYNLTDL